MSAHSLETARTDVVAYLYTTEWGDKQLGFDPEPRNPQWKSQPLVPAGNSHDANIARIAALEEALHDAAGHIVGLQFKHGATEAGQSVLSAIDVVLGIALAGERQE